MIKFNYILIFRLVTVKSGNTKCKSVVRLLAFGIFFIFN